MRIEVVDARPADPKILAVELDEGATVRDALAAAGFAATGQCVGVFGRCVPQSAGLRDGDRVEIYRPLQIDPKATRLERARRARKPATGTTR